MKKLILLAAFVFGGFISVNAQSKDLKSQTDAQELVTDKAPVKAASHQLVQGQDLKNDAEITKQKQQELRNEGLPTKAEPNTLKQEEKKLVNDKAKDKQGLSNQKKALKTE